MPSEPRILAIETSTKQGSVALLESDRVSAEGELPKSVGTAQAITGAIDSSLRSLGWTPGDIQIVAVANGPGSFTGLRVGVTTAKAFAYATGADVIAVDSLECIAAQAAPSAARIHVVIDAQRGDLCTAVYQRQSDSELQLAEPRRIVAHRDWINSLKPGDTVIGPGLAKIKLPLPDGVEFSPSELWKTTAANVGRLAWAKYQLGHRDDFWTLSPVYYRKSAAEEKQLDG